ncbi:MAG: hypothetical protein RR356_01565 [Bacteroidales bacterium]
MLENKIEPEEENAEKRQHSFWTDQKVLFGIYILIMSISYLLYKLLA